jgi:DNA-binding transcriptional MerR regulator
MNAADRVNKTNKYLSTTDVCREANVTRGQLRLYERDGLLVAPIRSGSGYRKYNLEVLDRLKAIQSLKELGLTLSEIAGLLSERDYIGLDASKIQQKAADMLLKT